MKILAFDVGKKTGVTFKDKIGETVTKFQFESMMQYLTKISSYILLFKPDIVTYSDTVVMTRSNSVKSLHFLMAMIELACQKQGKQLMVISDSEAKKEIIGKGNANKEDVWTWSLENRGGAETTCDWTQDMADSFMFANYVYKKINSLSD